MKIAPFAIVMGFTLLTRVAVAQFDLAGQPVVRSNTIGFGAQSPQTKSGVIWINTQADLEAQWPRWTSGSPCPRGIDFAKETIMIATMGERSTGGYRIFVRSAQYESGNVVIRLAEESPHPESIVSQALTRPFVAVRFDRLSGPVRIFREGCFAPKVAKTRPGYPDYTPMFPVPADYDVLATGDKSGVSFSRSFVLRTESELRDYVRKYHDGRGPDSRDLGADWRRDQVVAIHLGQQVSGGFQIEVSDVEFVSEVEIRVRWTALRPERGMATNGMTSPFLLMRIPRAPSVKVLQNIGRRGWD